MFIYCLHYWLVWKRQCTGNHINRSLFKAVNQISNLFLWITLQESSCISHKVQVDCNPSPHTNTRLEWNLARDARRWFSRSIVWNAERAIKTGNHVFLPHTPPHFALTPNHHRRKPLKDYNDPSSLSPTWWQGRGPTHGKQCLDASVSERCSSEGFLFVCFWLYRLLQAEWGQGENKKWKFSQENN